MPFGYVPFFSLNGAIAGQVGSGRIADLAMSTAIVKVQVIIVGTATVSVYGSMDKNWGTTLTGGTRTTSGFVDVPVGTPYSWPSIDSGNGTVTVIYGYARDWEGKMCNVTEAPPA